MNNTWVPESESVAVTLMFPEGWTELAGLLNLRALVEVRLRELILQSADPEWEVRHFLTTLDEAGLIDPYVDRKELEKANRQEIYNLLDRPELMARIYDLADVSRKDFPLKPNRPKPDWYDEITLLDWANAVAAI
jgi:hypothetical protein